MALNNKDFLLIYNPKYLDYFTSKLKDRFIPVTFDEYVESYLRSRDIKTIGILNYISDADIERITSEVWSMAGNFITELDESNRRLYKKIFGTDKINLLYATIGYLFKRFVVRCVLYLKGLESAIVDNHVSSIYYIDDGSQNLIYHDSKEIPSFFSDDVAIKIIENWNFNKRPAIKKIKPLPMDSFIDQDKRLSMVISDESAARVNESLLRHKIKQKVLSLIFDKYSYGKKTLLLSLPLYDLEFILNPRLSSLRNITKLKSRFNIITWDADNNICPNFIEGQPRHNFFHEKKRPQELNYEEVVSEFSFDLANFKSRPILENFQILNFINPLIRNFLKTKIDNIIEYWQAIDNFHSITQIDALLWGNAPTKHHRGIITEFCRVNKIPIIGMQHGGLYGSNCCIGKPMLDSDLKRCDYYFSYGFGKDTLIETYQNEQAIPEIIPVGSSRIDYLLEAYKKSFRAQKTKVKILYPVAVPPPDFFVGNPGRIFELGRFQKKIIDKLASFHGFKIILEFYHGSYKVQPLKPYIENLYKDKFIITDNISFGESLQRYDIDTVLMAQQSSSLIEAVGTKMNIILYNNEIISGLTREAYNLLSKRAIICNSQEDFLDKIADCMNNKIDQKDIEDRAFLEKYCVYKGNPEKNIVNAISSILTG